MKRRTTIRPWQRDQGIKAETRRAPYTTGQLARLLGAPPKKLSERLCHLARAGFVQRTPSLLAAMQGRPQFLYYNGSRPSPRTLEHTLAVTEVRVQVAEWNRRSPEYHVEFFYGHEQRANAGILPDAVMLVKRANRVALYYVEVDRGTEPIHRKAGYSIAAKLSAYAAHFDSGRYQDDFASTGVLRGFRVLLVVPAGRRKHALRLIAQEGHDFVLLSTFEDCQAGIERHIWHRHDGTIVDLLGRPQDLPGDLVGEKVQASIPTTEDRK